METNTNSGNWLGSAALLLFAAPCAVAALCARLASRIQNARDGVRRTVHQSLWFDTIGSGSDPRPHSQNKHVQQKLNLVQSQSLQRPPKTSKNKSG